MQQETVTIPRDDGLVIVDTSYFVFNRYFATLKWFRISTKTVVDIAELHNNSTFMTALKAHIDKDLANLLTYPYMTSPFTSKLPLKHKSRQGVKNTLLLGIDCKRADIWRMKAYPGYKQSRKVSADININVIGAFYDHLNSYISLQKAQRVEMGRLEADDVIYLTIKKIRALKEYQHPILAITNDSDFLQLAPLGTYVINMTGVNLIERAVVSDSKVAIMVKVLRGDKSDNIEGLACVNSDKQALLVANMTEKSRSDWIAEKGQSCADVYRLNKKMILLSQIPRYLAQAFYKSYSFKTI